MTLAFPKMILAFPHIYCNKPILCLINLKIAKIHKKLNFAGTPKFVMPKYAVRMLYVYIIDSELILL